MTVISSSAASSLLSYAGAGAAYTRNATTQNSSSTGVSPDATQASASNATTVTLSDQARALLAAQDPTTDFATVTANARTTLDQLSKDAGVSSPLSAGKLTIDLSALDRRSLFAIASNSQNKFSKDEQTAAAQELQSRFDAAIGPKLAAADLTGDYSVPYKAALDYLDSASAEEKASPAWLAQHTALEQGYKATQLNKSVLPTGIANDPIADLAARTAQNPVPTDSSGDFSSLADTVRANLDQQYVAAKRNGTELVFDPQRKTGQLVDFSGFDNRSLAAITLNQGNQFSPDEVRSAKKELDSRNRASMLQALQSSQASGDPRDFSLGLLTQYTGMSPEERQAANWTTSFRDSAVANYKSASTLLSMLSQLNTGQSGTGDPLSSGLF